MGAYIFVIKRMIKKFRKNLLYLISLIFPVVIIFNLMNIMNNSSFFVSNGIRTQDDPAEEIIFFLTLLVCVFTFYSNSYFVIGKSKEMAIEELSGIWPSKLARMLLIENTILEILSCILGILIGIVIMPAFLIVMYNVTGRYGSLWVISPSAIWGTIAILALQLAYVTIGDYSYLSTRDIVDLINVHRKVRPHDNSISLSLDKFLTTLNLKRKPSSGKSKILSSEIDIYLIVYLSSIIYIFISPKYIPVPNAAMFSVLSAIYSLQGLLRHSIPRRILKLKKEKYISDKIKLISLSNLYLSLKQLKFLLITLTVSIELLLWFISSSAAPKVKTVCIIAYITVIILIAGSILYKTIIESSSKANIFMQLSLIGYTKDQIKQIIKQEFKIYYFIVIFLPLFHLMIFLTLFLKTGVLPVGLLVLMLSVFILTFSLTALLSYTSYKNIAFKKNMHRFL